MRVLGIDPGPKETAYALIDSDTCRPLDIGKEPNDEMRWLVQELLYRDDAAADVVAIEMVASYGMAVGAEVFETCVWIGRFVEVVVSEDIAPPLLVYRREVKVHVCHSAKAKDANITQALIDRFAPGQPNRGKGTKAQPGWFYGFSGDVWQAYALAVYVADTAEGRAA